MAISMHHHVHHHKRHHHHVVAKPTLPVYSVTFTLPGGYTVTIDPHTATAICRINRCTGLEVN